MAPHADSEATTVKAARRVRRGGAGKTERWFVDLVIGGHSFHDLLVGLGHDFVSCLGWLPDEHDRAARERLLARRAGDLPDGRVSLWICPECADLGCGAITARVVRVGARVIWEDIGYQNDYEEGFHVLDGARRFVFDADEYEAAIQGA